MELKSKHDGKVYRARTKEVAIGSRIGIILQVWRGDSKNVRDYYYSSLKRLNNDWEDA